MNCEWTAHQTTQKRNTKSIHGFPLVPQHFTPVGKRKKSWMRRASIPLPIPCEGITLPFELHTHFCFLHSTTPFQTTTPHPLRRQDTHAITPNPLQNQKWKNLPRNQKHKKRIIMDLALNIAVWSGLALSCIACLVVFPLILGNEGSAGIVRRSKSPRSSSAIIL